MRTTIALLIGAAVCAGTAPAQPADVLTPAGRTHEIKGPNARARCAAEPIVPGPRPAPRLPAVKAATSANPPAVYSGRYVGCFADREQRDLEGPQALQASPQACINYCAEQEFRFASMQNGNHCFCGNSYGRYGASDACGMCAGRPDENCGGTWANAVWELSGRMIRLPLPPTLLPPKRPLPAASPPAN